MVTLMVAANVPRVVQKFVLLDVFNSVTFVILDVKSRMLAHRSALGAPGRIHSKLQEINKITSGEYTSTLYRILYYLD